MRSFATQMIKKLIDEKTIIEAYLDTEKIFKQTYKDHKIDIIWVHGSNEPSTEKIFDNKHYYDKTKQLLEG